MYVAPAHHIMNNDTNVMQKSVTYSFHFAIYLRLLFEIIFKNDYKYFQSNTKNDVSLFTLKIGKFPSLINL